MFMQRKNLAFFQNTIESIYYRSTPNARKGFIEFLLDNHRAGPEYWGALSLDNPPILIEKTNIFDNDYTSLKFNFNAQSDPRIAKNEMRGELESRGKDNPMDPLEFYIAREKATYLAINSTLLEEDAQPVQIVQRLYNDEFNFNLQEISWGLSNNFQTVKGYTIEDLETELGNLDLEFDGTLEKDLRTAFIARRAADLLRNIYQGPDVPLGTDQLRIINLVRKLPYESGQTYFMTHLFEKTGESFHGEIDSEDIILELQPIYELGLPQIYEVYRGKIDEQHENDGVSETTLIDIGKYALPRAFDTTHLTNAGISGYFKLILDADNALDTKNPNIKRAVFQPTTGSDYIAFE